MSFRKFNYLIIIACFLVGNSAVATPMDWGAEVVKPLRWSKGSTLNVYVQTDPDNKGRDALAKEGIERWKTLLSDRGITLNVSIGTPPAGTTNPIPVTWDTVSGGDKGEGYAGSDDVDTGFLDNGRIKLEKSLASTTDADKNFIKNLAEHELTHVLGLADDDNSNVMKHLQPSTAREFNEQDTKELNLLYGTKQTAGVNTATGNISLASYDPNIGSLKYKVSFVPGNSFQVLDDPEHVSLINIGIEPRLVKGLNLPVGWIGIMPGSSVSKSDSFFTEGYMIDSDSSLPPWDNSRPMAYLSLRTSVQEALNDGLPIGYDPALAIDNPHFYIEFLIEPNLPLNTVHAYAGGGLQTVPGPVPGPLPILGASLMFGWARKLRNRINKQKA